MRTVGQSAMYRISRFRGQGETLHLAQLIPAQMKSHVALTKNPGEVVNVVWPTANIGDEAGQAYIEITESGQHRGDSDEITILPGQTVNVNATWILAGNFPQGLHNLVATIFDWNSGNPVFLDDHTFTVNVPPTTTGPVLVPDAGSQYPLIT